MEDLQEETDHLNKHLGNLLAVIHRDGGHYQGEVGTEQAAKVAEKIVCDLRTDKKQLEQWLELAEAERDALKHTNAAMHDELEEAHDEALDLRLQRDEANAKPADPWGACQKEIDRLRAALRKYGRHSPVDGITPMCERDKHSDYPCTCGFEDALEGGGE
jgi:chromosome segregation ATPase